MCSTPGPSVLLLESYDKQSLCLIFLGAISKDLRHFLHYHETEMEQEAVWHLTQALDHVRKASSLISNKFGRDRKEILKKMSRGGDDA